MLFSCQVVSDSLLPSEMQHTRLPCSYISWSLLKLCPMSWWWYLTISCSAAPFSSCLQSFPASGTFPMSWLFHQVAKVLELQFPHRPFQQIFRVDFLYSWLTCSPCSLGDSQESYPAPKFESIHSSVLSLLMGQLSNPFMTTRKTIILTIQTFVSKVMSLLLNMLSRFVIAFLARSKSLLISWLQSLSIVILEPKK